MAIKRNPSGHVLRGSEMSKLGQKLQADRRVLASALNKINKTIYAIGAPLGSPEYFKIRRLCVDSLTKTGMYRD